MGKEKKTLKEVRMSKEDVTYSKECEYGLLVARSSIRAGLGDWNFFDFFEFVGRF